MIEDKDGESPRKIPSWVESKTIGGISEIAVLAPIRLGCPPGERRTYVECVASAIQNLADRHQQGLPTELGRIPAIHFGRMIIIRPEQYLLYSDLEAGGVKYYPAGKSTNTVKDKPNAAADNLTNMAPDEPTETDEPTKTAADKWAKIAGRIPLPIDDYLEGESKSPPKVCSFLLTLVEFDGDLKSYMRDIAEFLARDFDRVFINCEDFPGTRNFEHFWLWIKRYQINTNLFYAPYSNLSTVRIKQLEDFKRRFDALVARIYSPAGTRVRSVEELFDEFLQQNGHYARNFPSPGGIFETDRS
jgi:hypothetical protein